VRSDSEEHERIKMKGRRVEEGWEKRGTQRTGTARAEGQSEGRSEGRRQSEQGAPSKDMNVEEVEWERCRNPDEKSRLESLLSLCKLQ